jgi:drug/metabolite transporter (DMT)-like permease
MGEPSESVAAARGGAGERLADPARSSRARGFALALAAALFWSTAGILVRLIETGTSWHIILYRSLGVTATLGLLIAVTHRGRVAEVFRRAGWSAVIAGLCAAASSVLFILALARVTVANALFMMGITPFIAAIGSQALLGERVPRRAWGIMALAAAGVAVMLGSGLALGQLAGNLLALGSASSFAANALLLRANRQTDMLPAVFYAGILGAALALAALGVMGLSPGVPVRDLSLGLAMGAGQLSLGLILYTRASRDLPAAELQLVATAEMVMAPLWVWIGMGETPNAATLVGGGLVILAILAQALGGQARARR